MNYHSKKEAGFAVVIAIVLMAFILLLLLGLLSMSSIELQSSGLNLNHHKAQENARYGMLVALGQLQSLAGPDTRMTSKAEIFNSASTTFDKISAEKSQLTAIYNVNYDSTTDTYSSGLLSFLISGIEGNALDPLGEVQAMDWPINNKGESTDEDYAVLVGVGSVSIAKDIDGNGLPDDIIVAKKMELGNGGRYGYWVADEGVKARINLEAPSINLPPGSAGSRMHMGAPGKSPGSVLSGFADFPENGNVESLLSPSSIALMNAGSNSLGSAAQQRFHDFSLFSEGIPTNTAQGGLKKDLSLAFEMSDANFNQSEDFAGSGGFPHKFLNHTFRYVYNKPLNASDSSSATLHGPTWHLLRNHYRTYYDVQNAQNDPLLDTRVALPLPSSTGGYDAQYSVPETFNLYVGLLGEPLITDKPIRSSGEPIIRPTREPITPIVTRIQNYFSFRTEELQPGRDLALPPVNTNTPEQQHQYKLQLVWDPVVTLWNPYNVSLSLNGLRIFMDELPIDFIINTTHDCYVFDNTGEKHPNADSSGFALPRVYRKGGLVTHGQRTVKFASMLGIRTRESEGNGNTQNIENRGIIDFRIGEGGNEIVLEPGEIRVYSLNTASPVFFNNYPESYDSGASGQWTPAASAEMGFSAESGFAFDTGITGKAGDQATFELKHTNKLASASVYLVKDWSSFDERFFKKDITQPEIASIVTFEPQNPSERSTTPIKTRTFGSIVDRKDWFAQLDIYMKSADETNYAVALGAYNNPRALSTTPVGYEHHASPYSSSDPLWAVRLAPVGGTPDLVQATASGRGYWGESNVGGNSSVTLFEVPTAPLTSLGQLMHLNSSYRGHTPMYEVGSSFASPFVPRDTYYASYKHVNNFDAVVPDTSYLMNEALWDGYFFSSLTPTDVLNRGYGNFAEAVNGFVYKKESLPNSRIVLSSLGDDGMSAEDFIDRVVEGTDIRADAHRVSAANLRIEGAFNINSTSVEAWKSILSGLRDEAVAYFDSESLAFSSESTDSETPFSKFTLPNGSRQEAWRGYSTFTDSQIEELATSIVDIIHKRGPFPTLATFVNRKLSTDEEGLAGVIEAAIQTTDINQNDYGAGAEADSTILKIGENSERYGRTGHLSRKTGIPGNLTQADVLMALGGMITNRSDTFVIRSYGEVLDPLTNEPISEAWLETVVQRTSLPVQSVSSNPRDPAFFEPPPTADGNFGREFRIVSMRWLNKDEV